MLPVTHSVWHLAHYFEQTGFDHHCPVSHNDTTTTNLPPPQHTHTHVHARTHARTHARKEQAMLGLTDCVVCSGLATALEHAITDTFICLWLPSHCCWRLHVQAASGTWSTSQRYVHTHTHTRTHTRARTHTHTHAHARTHAHSLIPLPPVLQKEDGSVFRDAVGSLIVAIFTGMFLMSVSSLACYHTSLIFRNVTTNEDIRSRFTRNPHTDDCWRNVCNILFGARMPSRLFAHRHLDPSLLPFSRPFGERIRHLCGETNTQAYSFTHSLTHSLTPLTHSFSHSSLLHSPLHSLLHSLALQANHSHPHSPVPSASPKHDSLLLLLQTPAEAPHNNNTSNNNNNNKGKCCTPRPTL